VHKLEASSAGFQEKVTAYENCLSQLEKFQDDWMRGMNDKFDKVDTDLVEMALHPVLTDVVAYNPSAEADYLSALQRLQSVNFSLIAELKSNKDASIDTIMNLLCLEDSLAEKLGLTESQPHVHQLMVPIHHSLDQHVVGASTLSLLLDVSSSRV
nr:hypothetical protein [Tanacetum cinerariifolium]